MDQRSGLTARIIAQRTNESAYDSEKVTVYGEFNRLVIDIQSAFQFRVYAFTLDFGYQRRQISTWRYKATRLRI